MALEIGCVCTTTLMAHTTAMNAKIRKIARVISSQPRNQKAGRQQVRNRDREKELPREAHELVIAEPRQRAANPNKSEKHRTRLSAEPEERQQPCLHHRQQENRRDPEEGRAKYGKRAPVAPVARVHAMVER